MWSKTIQDVAEQLSYLIKDHDVCLMVAKLYVKERIHRATEDEREFHMSNLDIHGHYYRTDHKLFGGQLRYLSSKTTIRGQYWRASAAAWQIPNLSKKNLTLKDKLNDLNYIPRSILTGVVMKYWFHDRGNEDENNYITV
tara:strand:- start:215 stop:634 length:420 start_codon:yes stop_codon:yes gene_type:complete